jgi:dipeptidyl aminopeptidase/acylaminoacyl peptidase
MAKASHTTPHVAPYGSWKSPITADLITAEVVWLNEIALDGRDIYWIEMRPSERGRSVIVRRTPDGKTTDVTPPDFNARTRVHEYGGGAYTVSGGHVYFANFDDQRIYEQAPGGAPRPVTPDGKMRYADFQVDRARARLICVREDHTPEQGQAINSIVGVRLDGGLDGHVLVAGNDFYASPRLSPDGTKLAWLTWNHPNMPWDGCELWVGELRADGMVGDNRRVAGGQEESIFQPEWSPDGALYFVSDRTNWWNLYRWRDGQVEPAHERAAEFGMPQWAFGMSTYAFVTAERIACAYNERGEWRLALLDTTSGALDPLALPHTAIQSVRAMPESVVFVGASPTDPAAVVRLDLKTRKTEALRRSASAKVDEASISRPELVEFPTEGGKTAFGIYYPPRSADYTGPQDERAPLIVRSHGGPTSAFVPAFGLATLFWTSRGFGVLDINYGGSTGYGREYRQRLNDKWGIVDVDDCVNGAKYLAQRGAVDGERLAITGGSAGGYTTLAALAFRDAFKAGSSHYGVSDLSALARETHKFESRYMDGLVGPYPECEDLYRERSPLFAADRISAPVILFQGLEDKVVPPNQAELIVAALRTKGVPVAYLAFEGEGHGFRRAENIKRALEAELDFYGRIFGFAPADTVEPAPIENLEKVPSQTKSRA